MNFLAHIYLSGNNDLLMIGNFIADHVKGRTFHTLQEDLQKGILLHRKIDAFTDNHPMVHLSKTRLRPNFHKYAPVIADVFYDHFLAKNWDKYSSIPLHLFAGNFYKKVQQYNNLLPERTKMMLPYMVANNWLVSYASIEGIHKVMTGMSKRTNFVSGMEFSAIELEKNYRLYENEFTAFFMELQEFTSAEIALII